MTDGEPIDRHDRLRGKARAGHRRHRLPRLPHGPPPAGRRRRATGTGDGLLRDEAKQHDLRIALRHAGTQTDEIIYHDADELIRFRIGDIRDHRSVRRALDGVDLVVHAAAMKQVPACEYAPWEAVRTNVEGAAVLVEEVRSAGSIEAVVGVSTDKACLPVNVMGMTKALMERILIEANLASGDTRFLCVRYGNVLASRGSVIPVLRDQLARGGPLTLTDPGMTRFFLTLDAASDTVAAALAHGRAGEVWVPRVGAARMVDVIGTGPRRHRHRGGGHRHPTRREDARAAGVRGRGTAIGGARGLRSDPAPRAELPRREAPSLDGVWTSADDRPRRRRVDRPVARGRRQLHAVRPTP